MSQLNGRVIVEETGTGVANLVVSAFDVQTEVNVSCKAFRIRKVRDK